MVREQAMWQPDTVQWCIIWIVAVFLILAWPPDNGRSLGAKGVNWLADPLGSLPVSPAPLPMGLDDNGDAVTAHDTEEAQYTRAFESSSWIRMRMHLKTAGDPFDPSTERQLLTGIGILSALAVWRLNAGRKGS
jgi:hypothetical protein